MNIDDIYKKAKLLIRSGELWADKNGTLHRSLKSIFNSKEGKRQLKAMDKIKLDRE